jgi:hypothetical protein
MASALADLTVAVRAQREVAERGAALARESSESLQKLEKESRDRDTERVRRELAQKQDERDRLRPELLVRLRSTGPFIHHLWLDVHNARMGGQNLVVSYSRGGTAWFQLPGQSLPSRSERSFDLGDVTAFPDRATIGIRGTIADAVGNLYRFSKSYQYQRQTGLFGITTAIQIHPLGYQPVDSMDAVND